MLIKSNLRHFDRNYGVVLLVWERQGVHEDPKHVFFSYGFSGPKFNVDYGKSCSQAQIKVEQVRNSIFVGGRMSKIAQISRNCLCSY